MSRIHCLLTTSVIVVFLALCAVGQASAQSFNLDSGNNGGFWFDGEDLLVTTGAMGVTLRHRSGVTRRLRSPRSIVAGRGQGRAVELITLGGGTLGRLRDGRWETVPVVVPNGTRDIVLADGGEAMAWNSSTVLLVHIGADNTVTRVDLPSGMKPLGVFASDGGFDVVVDSEEHLLMRYENGLLRAHDEDARLVADGGCPDPEGVVQLPDRSFVVHGQAQLCHFGPGAGPTIIPRLPLLGDERRYILQVALVGSRLFIYDSRTSLTTWQPGESGGTRVADHVGPTRLRGMWADPHSDQVVLRPLSGITVRDVPTGHRARQASGDGAWLAQVQADDGTTSDRSGLRFFTPILRLSFGGLASLQGAGGGAFAFDLASGIRFLFRRGFHHPLLNIEFGYSRRGGDYSTHDLTAGVAFGYSSARFGVQVAESLVLAVGSGRSGLGVRSALRIFTLAELIGIEVSHGLEFETNNQELRIQLMLDIAQLPWIGATLSDLRGEN